MGKSLGTILRRAKALLPFSCANPEACGKNNAAMKRQQVTRNKTSRKKEREIIEFKK